MTYLIEMPKDEGSKYTKFRYPAGEVQVRLMHTQLEEVASATKVIVSCTIKDGDVMPLAQLTDAIKEVNNGVAHEFILVLPYLPYGRADRRFLLGDCDGLKTFGAIIDSLGYNYVATLDAHSLVTRRAISNLINVSPKVFIEDVIAQLGYTDLTILLPDKGATRYKEMLKDYNVLFCNKKRNPVTGELEGFEVPPVSSAGVLIVDDLCDGGGTFMGIAKELPLKGKFLYVTHGVFSKGVDALYENFDGIFTTDSFTEDEDVNIATCLPHILSEIDQLVTISRCIK